MIFRGAAPAKPEVVDALEDVTDFYLDTQKPRWARSAFGKGV